MKKIPKVFVFLLLINLAACHHQLEESLPAVGEETAMTRALDFKATDYYLSGGEKFPLQKIDGKFHVVFRIADEPEMKEELNKASMKLNKVEALIDHARFTDVEPGKKILTGETRDILLKKLEGSNGKIFDNCKTATVEGNYEKVAAVLSHAVYWSPYYRLPDGEEMRVTEIFTVVLKPGTTVEQLEKLAAENGVEMIGRDEFTSNWYHLACTRLSNGHALEMANLFYESGLFEDSFPNTIQRIKLDCINEPLFESTALWHLGNNPVKSWVHVDYCNMRTILSQGSSSITVAIIDDGIRSDHPDLYNVLPGRDAHTETSPNYGDVSGNTSYHGTEVAGFIGAIPNNGDGVAGIAYGVTILPVSFKIHETAPLLIRKAFYYAADNARVINCSWKYSNNTYITEGINYALSKDRVVVFSAGNDYSSTIPFPANLDPRIIVVGSVNKSGVRSEFSNYGPKLDLVAPAESVGVIRADDAIAIASGTSFAAPQVAAAAAMVLSLRPSLTSKEVADIIEKSAQKISGTYSRSSEKPWGWSSQVGSGILNAYDALTATTCIKDIYNQAVTTSTTVIGCKVNASYVTVSNGAGLTMQAPDITITGTFTVQAGSSLILVDS
jgi:hypothetical protein